MSNSQPPSPMLKPCQFCLPALWVMFFRRFDSPRLLVPCSFSAKGGSEHSFLSSVAGSLHLNQQKPLKPTGLGISCSLACQGLHFLLVVESTPLPTAHKALCGVQCIPSLFRPHQILLPWALVGLVCQQCMHQALLTVVTSGSFTPQLKCQPVAQISEPGRLPTPSSHHLI